MDKEKQREYNKQYYLKNRDKLKEAMKQYYIENKDQISEYSKNGMLKIVKLSKNIITKIKTE